MSPWEKISALKTHLWWLNHEINQIDVTNSVQTNGIGVEDHH